MRFELADTGGNTGVGIERGSCGRAGGAGGAAVAVACAIAAGGRGKGILLSLVDEGESLGVGGEVGVEGSLVEVGADRSIRKDCRM